MMKAAFNHESIFHSSLDFFLFWKRVFASDSFGSFSVRGGKCRSCLLFFLEVVFPLPIFLSGNSSCPEWISGLAFFLSSR